MITTQDSLKLPKNLGKIFATKKEMSVRFDQVDMRLNTMGVRLNELTSDMRIIKNNYTRHNEIVAKYHDEIMGELRTMRDEHTIGAYRQREHSDQLENHEDRIVKLEKKTTALSV